MAYPNIEKEIEGDTVELMNPASETEKRSQIGFDGLSKQPTTPTNGGESSQLLTNEKPEGRPRLNTAERVSIVYLCLWL